MTTLSRFLLLAVALSLPLQSLAQVPKTLHYQGYLTTGAGAPVSSPVAITFGLYDDKVAGNLLWSETHPSVSVVNGNYQVILGNVTPFSVDFSAPYWLGVAVGADAEMDPRQPLSMVPYAYRAVIADNVSPGATVQGSQVVGAIAGSQVTGPLSGSTLAELQAQFVGPLQPTSVAANTLTTVDASGDVGHDTSITIGTDGLPVIAYMDASGGISTLKVAKCADAACSASTRTTVDFSPIVGHNPSIAIGADGFPIVSHWDGFNTNLKVAKCVNAACTGTSTLSTVEDSPGNVGNFSSIAIGADGLPVIAYYDTTNGNLKVAKCANAACSGGTSTLSTVDSSANDVGQFVSIAIGADGLPVIAYYDATSFDLKAAKCTDPACTTGTSTITTVDSSGNVGPFTSIAIGVDGLPVISYFGDGNLRVAKCVNPACAGGSTLGTLDSAGSVGQRTSIAISADGLPVISYLGSGNAILKVAKCANPACTAGTSTLSTVDSGGVGLYGSIAIGAGGLPVISYYDATNTNLKVAKCANVFCAPYIWRR